jgi:NTP pyrophosphatase (non-canonical NTP hydrolase)
MLHASGMNILNWWRLSLTETKSEIQARLDEVEKFIKLIEDRLEKGKVSAYPDAAIVEEDLLDQLRNRSAELAAYRDIAAEDLFKSVIRSHEAVCAAKQMDEKAAYGQDPAVYYTLAICGESGEMGNKIVKSLRNGNDPEAAKRAVISELPDVFIYGAVLAHVLDLDLTRLVNEKVDIVIQRAADGYYGGPLPQSLLHGEHLCEACGKMTRDTTAGCDHCDYEDK